MRKRVCGFRCVIAALAAAGCLCVPPWRGDLGAQTTTLTSQPPPSDDDTSLREFILTLETIVKAGDRDAFVALEGPLGSADDARAFAAQEIRPGSTRVVIQERDRQEVTLTGIPGSGYSLTVDAFIEAGNQARVTTWQLLVRRSSDSWGLVRQEVVSSVESLFRLSLSTAREYDAKHLVITSEDLELVVDDAVVFTIDIDQGTTGLVVSGRGEMHFFPAPATEKGQVRIFSGSEVLETKFDAVYVRVGRPEIHFDRTQLVPRAVDPRDLKRAQQIFREESPKSFAVDLADLTREAWTLLPGPDDFLSEVRTRRFGTLTYARSSSEPEDITLFERRRHRNIALYASKAKLQERGRFYNEDDLAPFDVLDYDIDVTAQPERPWIDGRARMRLRVRSPTLGQLTLRLADPLVVRSIVSDRFGRMFNLRVSNQNTVLVNLPALLLKDSELTLTVVYGGRLEPQAPDRETIAPGQISDQPVELPPDVTLRAEPSYLYSNRSYWYPQSTVSDYATARIRLTVPIEYGCVASGEPVGEPEVIARKGGLDVQHAYVFRADRPARYLSFILSRFVRTSRTTVRFPADTDPPPPSSIQEAGSATSVAAASTPVPAIDLIVDANPRATHGTKDLAVRTADIISFYRSIIGELPYPGFTLALVENVLPGGHSPPYFAELNQPLPNSPFTWRNDPAVFDSYPEFFVAHEIAHQWWGHGVGWQNYHEQWLSEGFAQYFAALYAEKYRGADVFQSVLRRMRRTAIDQSAQGPVHLGYRVGHIKSDGRAFRAIVYNKGAVALHMLRQLVGDDAFFRGIRRFYASSRFKKVGTEDFRAAIEEESGWTLERFFERWIYSAALPRIAFTYRVDPSASGGRALLRFEQSGDVFDIPALVTLEYADGRSKDVLVRIDDRSVELPVPLDGPLRSASISRRDVSLAEYRTN
jgi:hypothetical protein